MEDYIIASPDLFLRSEDEFYQLITQNTHRQVKLIVFNARTDGIREIDIVPDFEWGGDGCLGCDVGSGMVHWIPEKSKSHGKGNEPVGTPLISSETRPSASISPLMPSESPVQYKNPPSSSSSQPSPAKIHIPPVVSVNVPSSRPVIDNLSGGLNAPVNSSVITTAPPPPMTQFHHHTQSVNANNFQSHHQIQAPQAQFNPQNVDDDIPLPNFTVPSDIIHQK